MLKRFIKPVYAHCDVPCGIYETNTALTAALTCKVMTEKLEAADLSQNDKTDLNNFVREVTQKEIQAQIVKDQLYILWSDYFKPEHLDANPDLHNIIWNAVKQASEVKHIISLDAANNLLDQVKVIAKIFDETGGNKKVEDMLS